MDEWSKLFLGRMDDRWYNSLMPQKIILTQQQEADIRNLYTGGLSAREVAEQIGLSEKVVATRLKQWGIRRNWSQAKSKYAFNENAFTSNSPETFYWAGFLMADGNVWHSKGRQSRTSVSLHIKDRGHLVKFAQFLGMDSEAIYDYSDTKKSKLTIASNRVAKDLAMFGVVPRKSMIAEVPPERLDVIHSHDFWRGVVDGDGCIRLARSTYPTFVLVSGSERFRSQFEDYLKFHDLPLGIITQDFSYTINGAKCLVVIRGLYMNASMYLSRKYNKAMEMLWHE